MKFLVAFALIAVACATPAIKPAIVLGEQAQQIAQILEAIYSPSTDPATAAALESLLLETLGVAHPISVGPAIVDVPQPLPIVEPVKPSPVIIGEIPAGARAPLVQILVNVNDQASSVVAPGPVSVVDPVVPGPVSVVAPVVPGPVSVVAPVVPGPVSVVEPVVPGPVNVVDSIAVSPVSVGSPIAVSPISVGTPVLPSPAISLPDTLN